MAIQSEFVDGQVVHYTLGGNLARVENKIDFSEKNMVASSVIEALKIPAGALVHNVRVLVLTAEGGTLTATVGDGAGANSWDAATNLNSAGTVTAGLPGTDAYATAGKYYSAADTIDLTLSANAAETAIINVSADYSILERI
jgi:hypothetical protein